MAEKSPLKFEITENIGTLSGGAKGWTKELNLVSWNDRPAKYDIREWDETHEKMGKGVTLSKDEAIALKKLLIELEL
ncbi:MAG: PC4/YdbC family ssDNA-binding protein [Bacillota bacterium]